MVLFRLFPQQLAHGVPGQRLSGKLHSGHPLVEGQGAVGLGDEIPDGLLLVGVAVDDGADLLALFPDEASPALLRRVFSLRSGNAGRFFKKSRIV